MRAPLVGLALAVGMMCAAWAAPPMPVTPAKPAAKAPVKPAAKAPVKPAVKTPAKPAVKTPAKPAVKTPAKPAVKRPAKRAALPVAESRLASYFAWVVANGKSPSSRKLAQEVKKHLLMLRSEAGWSAALEMRYYDLSDNVAESDAQKAFPVQLRIVREQQAGGRDWVAVGVNTKGKVGAHMFQVFNRVAVAGGAARAIMTFLSNRCSGTSLPAAVHASVPEGLVGLGASHRQHILQCYRRNGSSTCVGRPTSVGQGTACYSWGDNNRVVIQAFDGGTGLLGYIIDNEGTNHRTAWWVHGKVLEKYVEMGGPDSPLGRPASDEQAASMSPWGTGGRLNRFERGSIYWSPNHGAHPVYGSIRDSYEGKGGTSGTLGFPKSDPRIRDGRLEQDFEGGRLPDDQCALTIVNQDDAPVDVYVDDRHVGKVEPHDSATFYVPQGYRKLLGRGTRGNWGPRNIQLNAACTWTLSSH